MEFAIQHTLSSKDIKLMRKRLGLKQKDFAALLNVSVKTVERWEEADVTVTGPAVTLLKILYGLKNYKFQRKFILLDYFITIKKVCVL